MAVGSEIPTEILSEIFYLLCKASISVRELNNLRCKEDFPWAVGMVCRQWRNAFLSYPPMWTSLTFSDSDPDPYPVETESYATEINRRLALYLYRSARYPLNLNFDLYINHNMHIKKIALKMILASSERWQTVKFNLFYAEWQADFLLSCKGKLPALHWLEIRVPDTCKHIWNVFEVAPRLTHVGIDSWEMNHGWILPWTQLTEVWLMLDGLSVLYYDVPKILPMLYNVKELRIRLDIDLIMGILPWLPLIEPISLNQLHVLEIPHRDAISWFDAPSLCDLYFMDYRKDDDQFLDIQEQISSLMQRSGCKIRKLSLVSGRRFYVGKLNDVEELEIDYRDKRDRAHYPPIHISSLPNLRSLIISCNVDDNIESLPNSLTTTLNSARVPPKNKHSTDTPISRLECITVKLYYYEEEPKIPKSLKKIADRWPVVFLTERANLKSRIEIRRENPFFGVNARIFQEG